MEPYPLSQLITPFILFCIALTIRAILSFLETSITALRLFKLKELAHTEKKYVPLLHTLEQTPQRVLITILVANSFIDVTSASLATFIMGKIFINLGFSTGLGFTFGIAFATVGIITFGEIVPKSFARARSDQSFRSVLWIIKMVYLALNPLVTILIRLSDYIIYKIGGEEALESGSQWISSEREIQFLINYIHEKGLLEIEKREMLQNIFELATTPVKDIMVPATDIISVEVETPMETLLEIFASHPFTRIPVYKTHVDNIIGMVHQKDILLSRKKNIILQDIIRSIMFVPESMKINQLLRNFREKQMHIAIVTNEHGIITGLITLEDILEEIVGEITDEHEPASEKIVPLQKDEHEGWLIDASIQLEDLEKFLGITFETEDSVSLAGFLAEYLQRIPQKDEQTAYKNFMFEIQKATPRVVRSVYVYKIE